MKYIALIIALFIISCKKDPSPCKDLLRKATDEAENEYYQRKDTAQKVDVVF